MEEKKFNRDDIRAAIFSAENKKAKTKEITLFGQQVDIRQPTLKQINAISQGSADSKTPAIVRIMIEYIYVPGTDQKVFDKADAEAIASMPSGGWLNDLNEAIEELTGVNVEEAEKNSETTD